MAILLGLEFGHLAVQAGLVGPIPPEVYYAYSGAEFNDQFGPAAAARLARDRADARMARKDARRRRYMRRHGQSMHKGLTGTAVKYVITDEIAHLEK